MPFRRRRRGSPWATDLPVPKHPYRDSAIVNAVLAALLLVAAWATGGELGRALIYALAFFAIATTWNWWRFRKRIEREAAAEPEVPPQRNGHR